MRRLWLSLLVVMVFALPAPAGASPILIASTGGSGSGLYSIDVATQVTTFIGATGVDRLSGLDFSPGGVLYGIAGGSIGPSSLYTLSTVSGLANLVGAVTGVQGADGLAFSDSGTLYAGGWDGGTGRLLTLNPGTGAIVTNIAMTGSGNAFVPGLDVGPGGVLWGSRGNAGGSVEDIVTIDTITGAQTAVGGDVGIVSGLWFDADGTLYAIDTGGAVLTVNTTTGAQTVLFQTGVNRLSGLTGFSSDTNVIPEPSSALLLGGGVALLLMSRRRRPN